MLFRFNLSRKIICYNVYKQFSIENYEPFFKFI